jgi:hypothetical protein
MMSRPYAILDPRNFNDAPGYQPDGPANTSLARQNESCGLALGIGRQGGFELPGVVR